MTERDISDWYNDNELPNICKHQWWVCGVTSGRTIIIVECRDRCGEIGTVDDATPDEYHKAIQFNYRWLYPARVTVRELREF